MKDLKEQEQEKWADIPGYVQSFTALGKTYSRPMYRVSNMGRVMSDYGQGCREITPQVSNYGQKVVFLTGKASNGESSTEMLSLLVARAFVPNPNGYKFINFKDGDPLNCRADNMEWTALTDKQRKHYEQATKKVNQYGLDGKYIKTHISAIEAAKDIGDNNAANAIRNSCKTHQLVGGYQWRYTKNNPEGVDIEPKTRTIVKYIMRDKETGAELMEFPDIKKVAEFLGKPSKIIQGSICQCYMGKRPSAYGYKWERIETEEAFQ